MSVQEAAIYGDLVLALRDYAAGQVAALTSECDVDTARTQLDEFIRTWFFTPQERLYGSAPREVIWREQLGEQNPIPREYAAEFYSDDCPICQAMRAEIESAESDESHGHFWYYCPDTCLLHLYDPQGSEERWQKELADMEEMAWDEEQEHLPAPDCASPAPLASEVDSQSFLSVLRYPWLDPELQQAAQQLAERCDVPLPSLPGAIPYRRITREEALCLVAGLHRQGVDIQALLAQIEGWPYQNIALDWLSQPEHNVALICQAIESSVGIERKSDLSRFRHHRDFVLALARLIPLGARLWLSGWLEAITSWAEGSTYD
jgi:hypothetical protein